MKVRLYALFQFFSFSSLLFLGIGLSIAIMNFKNNVEPLTKENWWIFLKTIFIIKENEKTVEIISSMLIYLFIVWSIFSWAIGWFIFSMPNRNYYDDLFLMFLVLPFISILFALLAQLSLKVSLYRSGRITSNELKGAIESIKEDLSKTTKN